MPIHRLTEQALQPLEPVTFASQGLLEGDGLQRRLKADISVVADDVIVIAEEFRQWDDSDRRIDLLGIDRQANLVVFEIKRDEKGGHMELQAIRYAAMVSSMTFANAVEVYHSFLTESGLASSDDESAESKLLDFLDWDEAREDAFAQDVRIVLVAADFSKEITTAVLWLNERDLDVRCVRIKPYLMDGQLLVDVQQVVPLPEASEYQVGVRTKAIVSRESARQQSGEPTGYWYVNVGDDANSTNRNWEDCRRYGFMTAGGGRRYRRAISRLSPGNWIFAYASGSGYVGYGRVVAAAVRQRDFIPMGEKDPLVKLPTVATAKPLDVDDDYCEWCVAVDWVKTVDREHGVFRKHARLGTVGQIKQAAVASELVDHFGPTVTDVDLDN